MKVIKRDGSKADFDKTKIASAIGKANARTGEMTGSDVQRIADVATNKVWKPTGEISVEEIQDAVEDTLLKSRFNKTAKSYILWRDMRTRNREGKMKMMKDIFDMTSGRSEYWNKENSNKDAEVVTTQRDYLAGIVSTEISKMLLLPTDVVKAHNEGKIHFHDMDYYAQNALHNCDLINLDDMLQNGTMINGIKIEKPRRLLTAATIATQIITAVASSQYGGCSIDLSDLAPFVDASRKQFYTKYQRRGLPEADCIRFSEEDLREEVKAAVQTFNYQINSMSTTNGQAPFITVFMYLNERPEYKKDHALLIEEFLKQRLVGMKNEAGAYITQAFPKLIYVLEEDNIEESSEYYYLTELSAKCTAKRMVPDYISEKIMKELKGDCYAVMGCRSALTPDRFSAKLGNIANAKNYIEGKHKYAGRFNQGVVTISLPDAALSSGGDMSKFWKIFDQRLELCHKALRLRHERLLGKTSDMAPILWQHGALARLKPGEKIDRLLYDGYSTLSLGYGGLYECVKYMTGVSHTDPKGKEFGLAVMQHMNDKCGEWKAAENIDYSLYGTPMESTTYKFATCLKKRFGDDVFIKLDGKDRAYITNSYHVPVFEQIGAFDKLALEAEFQKLSPGGAISYIETANLTGNPEAVLEVMKFIYNHIMYAELNTKSDFCQVCGYDGEMKIDDGMNWYCPNCGNRDQRKMNVARRTCGYIGQKYWNYGRTEEIKDRVVHLGDD
jgi:ribonucleoside-triphosphate reductase (formate)